MSSRALLLAPPGPFPFAGHFWLEARGDRSWIALSASIASSMGPVIAFSVARTLRAHLQGELAPQAQQAPDRNRLLRTLWETLGSAPEPALGPPGGVDLSVLALAGDRRGASVAGVGLSAVWGMYVDTWEPLAKGAHPLLGPAGRPSQVPGALRLMASPRQVIATLAAQPPELPPAETLLLRAGVRP